MWCWCVICTLWYIKFHVSQKTSLEVGSGNKNKEIFGQKRLRGRLTETYSIYA